uniref:Uncharacterized protein n=1 Tax=Lutzomyia longipalpis TaxID=7200 RepID=A0A1B0CR14_LUTLO
MYVCWVNPSQMGMIPSTIVWPHQYPHQLQRPFSPTRHFSSVSHFRSWTQNASSSCMRLCGVSSTFYALAPVDLFTSAPQNCAISALSKERHSHDDVIHSKYTSSL